MCRVSFIAVLYYCLSFPVSAQENDYDAAGRLYRANNLDSASHHSTRSIQRYRSTGQPDSLVFSYVQHALIVWSQQGLESALQLMDTAKLAARQLPDRHIGHVAVYSRIGQLLTQRYEFTDAWKYFKLAEHHLGESPPPNRHAALLYNHIAVLHLMQEDYVTAARYAERAYAMNLLLEGANGPDMVLILQTRFLISCYSGQFEQALREGKEFQRVMELHYPPGHPNIGSMHNSLAMIYEARRHYDQALAHRQQAVGIHVLNYNPAGDGSSLAAAYQNLGYLYRYIQEPFLAQEYLEKGIRLLVKQHGEEGLGMVHPWAGLARLKSELHRFDEATALYTKAFAVQQKHGANDLIGMAFVESSLGDNYLDQQQYALAEGYYQRALDKYSKAGVLNREDALHTQRSLALAKSALGDFEAAVSLQQEALAGFRQLYPHGNLTIAGMLLTFANIYRQEGLLHQALAYTDSAALQLSRGHRLPPQSKDWFSRFPFSSYTMDFAKDRVSILQELHKQTAERRYLLDLVDLADAYSAFMASNLHAFRSQAAMIEQANTNKAIYSMAMESCWLLSDQGKAESYTRKAFAYARAQQGLASAVGGQWGPRGWRAG